MSALVLSGAGIGVEDVAAVAREARASRSRRPSWNGCERARVVLDRVAASGQPIYGLNTGLGANLGTAVSDDDGAFQRQLLEGRSGAVGEPLPTDIVRATCSPAPPCWRRRLGHIAGNPLRFGRGAECRRASRHAVARFDRRRRPGDDGSAGRMLIGEGEAEYQGSCGWRPGGLGEGRTCAGGNLRQRTGCR